MLCRSFVNNAGDLKKAGKSSLRPTEHDQLRWNTPELAKAELLRFYWQILAVGQFAMVGTGKLQ
jgi:hypothetical protein